tara:strand:- start:11552 stop:12505 length:954 start_codon:yes stop_codon:yes gene_type:complete
LLPGCFYDYAIVDTNPETEIVYVETPGSGDGATVPLGDVWVDSFTQPTSANGVDVLWVIDTSGSMRTFQDELLVGIESMLNALPPSGWRLNMISNSPDKAAIDNQFPLVPGDDILDAEAMYNAMSVGHQEEGFDATYEYIVNNPYASTWMRHDAALLVVLVSDEEDQSNNHFPVVNDFVWWYTGLRTSVYLASIINLDPAVSLCNSSTHNAGYRYEDATGQLGGTVVDICSGDWSPGVTDASIQIEPYEEWTLSQAPIIDTITVFYDGIVDWRWIYDSDTSTVIFTTTPPAGALVEIVYIIAEETETADTGDTDTGS